jgi:electron-transferring-flavoprotein dehydrogenase
MPVTPFDYAPDVRSHEEFVTAPTAPEDERIEVGVVIVGGGPAGLACAIRLTQLLEDEPQLAESLGEVPVALVEKGKATGSHLLSGAMMDPSAMRKLFPDLDESDWPTYGPVERDAVYFMTKRRAIPLRPTPPPFRNHGNHVTSIAQLGRWLGERAEEAGVYVLPETAASKLLVEDGVVRGVRTGDKGRGRDGQELSNFEPGSDLIGRATVLAEGTQGHLSGAAIGHFDMASDEPPQWELGVKEVWEVQKPLDRVIHSMNWPLRMSPKYREFGGSFVYPMGEDKVSIGFVAGLDYRDATFSVHDILQEFKTHPMIRKILDGGKRIAWGAKTIPSGGYWAMPERFWAPGLCIAGDAASMCNVTRLKGIHHAMNAGMFAAEAIFEALKRDDTSDLSAYDDKVRDSQIETDFYKTRNQRQVFAKGFLVGGAIANMMEISGGRFPGGRWHTHDDAAVDVFIGDRDKRYPKPDGKYTFDKLSSVFATGNATRDDAPNHIRIQKNVPLELALMWQNMCPAQVYEVPEEALEEARVNGNPTDELDADRKVELQITPSNCVQCGAITAKGGRLTPPEGGDGPNYQVT